MEATPCLPHPHLTRSAAGGAGPPSADPGQHGQMINLGSSLRRRDMELTGPLSIYNQFNGSGGTPAVPVHLDSRFRGNDGGGVPGICRRSRGSGAMLIRDHARQARAGLSLRKRSDDRLKKTRSAAGTIAIAGYVRAPDPVSKARFRCLQRRAAAARSPARRAGAGPRPRLRCLRALDPLLISACRPGGCRRPMRHTPLR